MINWAHEVQQGEVFPRVNKSEAGAGNSREKKSCIRLS